MWEGLKELLLGFRGWSAITENEDDGEVVVVEELFGQPDKRDEMAYTRNWNEDYGWWFLVMGCLFHGRFWKVDLVLEKDGYYRIQISITMNQVSF